MKLLFTLFLACTVVIIPPAVSAFQAEGTVVTTDREPLIGVSLITNIGGVGTVTDQSGHFVLDYESDLEWVTFSSVGYQSRQFHIGDMPDTVVLERRYYRGTDILVTGDRARRGIDPVAFSNYSEDDVQRDYSVGEFPLLLETTPNLYTYTDGGAALGYSYVRIRGFDDKRIATYINGVPLNDPEDQATYFVDLPDFAANITDIQVQRGVGNSLYGGASFGGAMNIVTSAFAQERQVTVTSGFGRYTHEGDAFSDIYKQSVEYASGLVDGRWLFSGRFSKQKTGGYRRNSWYEGWSYYLSLARLDPNMTTELYIYGGPIRMHLSYWGIDRETLESDRLANPLGYDNETDNFNQPHYHLHNVYKFNDRTTLSNTLYYIRGKGYYEQLKNLGSYRDFVEYNLDTALVSVDEARLVRQQWVEKNQYGWNPRLDIEHDRGRHSIGGSFYYFESDHWGQVVWVEGVTDQDYDPRQRYYQYFGEKYEANLFAQEYFRFTDRLSSQATAFLRYQRYDFDQVRMGAFRGYQYDTDWLFFSPRLGLNFQASDHLLLFASVGVSSRTPTDATIYDANDPFVVPSLEILNVNGDSTRWEFGDPTANAERVYNIEIGGGYRTPDYAVDLNFFWMEFRDEILPYGAVDDDGLRRSVNADRSVHAGVELAASVKPLPDFTVDGNFSYNYNRVRDFVTEVDLYDENFDYAGTVEIDYADKIVSGFPEYTGNLIFDYRYRGFRGTWQHQFFGKQYLELLNIEELAIDPYYVSAVSLSYSFEDLFHLGTVTLTGRISNLFDKKYAASGYGGNYAYLDGGSVMPDGWAEYYPAAERWFFGELKLELF